MEGGGVLRRHTDTLGMDLRLLRGENNFILHDEKSD